MNLRRFSLFSLLISIPIFINSCTDDNTSAPVISKPKKIFVFKEGETYIYENGKGELCSLIVRNTEKRKWALSFWDTARKVELQSIIFEKKYYNGSVAVYDEFALVESDSGYLFGSANNPLIDKNYMLDYISYQFFIPNDFEKPVNETVVKPMKLGDLNYEVNYAAIWTGINDVYFPKDTLRKSYAIKYTAQRTNYLPTITGGDYIIASGVGFYKFLDYYLIKKI